MLHSASSFVERGRGDGDHVLQRRQVCGAGGRGIRRRPPALSILPHSALVPSSWSPPTSSTAARRPFVAPDRQEVLVMSPERMPLFLRLLLSIQDEHTHRHHHQVLLI